MNDGAKLLMLFIFFLLAFFLLNQLGLFASFNKYFISEPTRRCMVEQDCALVKTTCYPCDCGDAVNKGWQPLCIFKSQPAKQDCKCPIKGINFTITCIENKCEKADK